MVVWVALRLPVHCEACSLSQGAGPTASVSSGIWLEKKSFLLSYYQQLMMLKQKSRIMYSKAIKQEGMAFEANVHQIQILPAHLLIVLLEANAI